MGRCHKYGSTWCASVCTNILKRVVCVSVRVTKPQIWQLLFKLFALKVYWSVGKIESICKIELQMEIRNAAPNCPQHFLSRNWPCIVYRYHPLWARPSDRSMYAWVNTHTHTYTSTDTLRSVVYFENSSSSLCILSIRQVDDNIHKCCKGYFTSVTMWLTLLNWLRQYHFFVYQECLWLSLSHRFHKHLYKKIVEKKLSYFFVHYFKPFVKFWIFFRFVEFWGFWFFICRVLCILTFGLFWLKLIK